MADSIYSYRTPANFPDRVRIGEDAEGDFSNLEHDSAGQALKVEVYNDGAITGTWSFGSDGLIRFNTNAFSAGGEFTEEQLLDIGAVANVTGEVTIVADNIEAVVLVAAMEDIPDLVTAAAELEDIQDSVAINASHAADSETAAAASEAASATSANSAADSEAGAGTAQTAAEAARDEAVRYATAPPDEEVETGLLSARGYAVRTSALARQIAGFPSREVTGASDALIKTTPDQRGDEFSILYCTGATNKTITLPRNWSDIPAFDGSPSWVPVRIIRTGAGSVTLAGEGGTIVDGVVKTGTWQGSSKFDTTLATTTTVTRTITVAAGLKRVLWVGSFEVNEQTTSHIPTLASSVGVVTARVSATAPTGRYLTSPRVNAQSWTVALPDSAAASTSVTLTFTLPARYTSHNYRVVAASNVDAISGSTGASVTTPTLTPSVSVTSLAGSLVIAALAGNGELAPATLSGATAAAASASGGREFKDSTMICGEIANASAGSHVISATFTSDHPPNGKEAANLGISFDKASSGGSAVDVIGTPLTIGANSWIDVMALSDGVTYMVKGGA